MTAVVIDASIALRYRVFEAKFNQQRLYSSQPSEGKYYHL